jgi:hypothetical protein
MTLVIFAWLTSQPYFEDVTGIKSGSNLRDALNSGGSDFSEVFGGVVDGLNDDDFDSEFDVGFDDYRLIQ